MANIKQMTIENAELIFKNFEGRETMYNVKGNRNFNVILSDDEAAELKNDGWLVGTLQGREEDEDPRPKLKVGVRFDVFPPNITLISNGGNTRTRLTEDTVGILDTIDIESVDIIVRPYDWEFGGKAGTKAMLKTMYVIMREDELEKKYGVSFSESEGAGE